MFSQKRFLLVGVGILLIGLCLSIAGCAEEGEQPAAQQGKIIGIEPGAGVMQNTEEAIEEYNLDFKLVASSSAGMATELTKAINNNDWIVVTGWTPHWKFARFDLKYLEDPKGVYGGEEFIGTIARPGLEEDKPGLYAILERFNWKPEDMNSVMLDMEGGMKPEAAAQKWVDTNQATIDEWIGDVSGEGVSTKIAYVTWDSEIASNNVLKIALEEAGFDVNLVATDAGPMYQAVATGDADFSVSAWLPGTQANYWEEYKDDIVLVRHNLEPAKVGLVVPAYVYEAGCQSIADLNEFKDKFA